jgi:hypothetical protein
VKKGDKARKVTERKMDNMHLLETFCKASFKCDVKVDGNKG